jgi:nucleoside-diphosphate-sugar epimerase
MKILVTGGGGFIGLALVRRLVESGFEVSSFSRNIYPEHSKLGVTSFRGDLSNPAEIEKACEGIDAVFHVAAKVVIWGKYSDFYKTNVLGTKNVINACKKQGVRKLIFTSSASVVFDGSNLRDVNESINYPKKPVSHYTATKALAEQLVLQVNSDKLKTISLRPHLVWGPGDTHLIPGILKRAKAGKLRKPGRKKFWIDTTYIDNFIDAQLLALNALDKNPDCSGKAFFITNGHPVLIWDFINFVLATAGIRPVQKTIPKNLALFIAWILEKFHQLFHPKSEPYITCFAIHELTTHHWFDISAAKNMMGYSPKINLPEGLKRLQHFNPPS